MSTPAEDIQRYLRTGDYDMLFPDWPGPSAMERMKRASDALTDALVAEVRRREAESTAVGRPVVPEILGADFARKKLEPMVRGLFPRREQEPVLAVLERSVIFLTPDVIEGEIRRSRWLSSAWRLADIYLGSIGAEALDGDSGPVVGYSEETTCYVSLEYFSETDPFADYVVHEAAHVFHNTKRGTLGLKETRRREWPLPIAYRKREAFAYACEAYSRILERGERPAERRDLLAQLQGKPPPPDDRVAAEEYFDILAEAVGRRNGWRAILERCRG